MQETRRFRSGVPQWRVWQGTPDRSPLRRILCWWRREQRFRFVGIKSVDQGNDEWLTWQQVECSLAHQRSSSGGCSHAQSRLSDGVQVADDDWSSFDVVSIQELFGGMPVEHKPESPRDWRNREGPDSFRDSQK